ncbi:MAG: condensation domain-containing protein, partial [Actinomycetota bacterium]
YQTQANAVLLLALAEALTPWLGEGEIVLDLEGHGRDEDLGTGTDLSRTVGWFTAIHPVRLPLRSGVAVGERLKEIKERLRAVPRRGLGYGLLRYLSGDAALAAAPPRTLAFNYLGQMDKVVEGSSLLRFAPESAGPWHSPRARRPYPIEVVAQVLEERLELHWTFGAELHEEPTIRGLAERMLGALRNLLRHCLVEHGGGRTPSDFPLVPLDQASVDRLAGDGRDVEDILPLAPLQTLFLASGGTGVDLGFEQWRYRLRGVLDAGVLERAWDLVVNRHAALRAGFVSDGLPTPVQVIHRRATPRVTIHDWREVPPEQLADRLDTLLRDDRRAGFDLVRPPLLRITLIRLAEEEWELVWDLHHLVLDRWSWPIVLREVGAVYDALRSGREPD